MSNVARAIRAAHTAAVMASGTSVTVYRLTYASADNPFDGTQQHTISETWRGRGTWSPARRTHEPVSEQNTDEGTVTINARAITWEPTQADRVEIGGRIYNVVSVRNHNDAVYVIELAGPVADPGSVADETAPRFSGLSVSAGDPGEFDYSATANEAAQHRVRYRRPPDTGTWLTGGWSSPYETSISGTVAGLDSGTWEVAIQGRDAAGNVGDWFDMGTVIVAGVPA